MEENKNWMVVLKTKRGTELKGVYPTKRAALFISQRQLGQIGASKIPQCRPKKILHFTD